MEKEFAQLKDLAETSGVSGRESRIRETIKTYAQQTDFFDEIETDVLGNLICTRRSVSQAKARRILAVAHMDQAGFLVSHINAEGAVRLHPVGTYDLRGLLAQPVLVENKSGELLPGTLATATEPIHTDPQQVAPATLDAFYVELGLRPDDIREKVSLGDMVVFDAPFRQVGNHIVGAGLDDRIGCWALLQAVKDISNETDELVFAFSVQEELGSRGATILGSSVAPDIAI
ncbi:MAG: M42 family peptidase, partial [Pseudomonadota bacterium]